MAEALKELSYALPMIFLSRGAVLLSFWGTQKQPRGELSKKVNIIDCKTNSPFKVFIKLFQHLRTDKPLIIMSALDLPNIILGLAASLLLFKGKVIMSQRAVLSAGGLNLSPFLKKIKDTLLKISFYRSDLIISNSCAAERELKNWLHLSERRIKTIHNGINIELIQEKAKEPSFKIFTQPYIISVGTLIKRKNHQFLLDAFSSVLKKHPCHLVLLGDGVELENLQKYCKQQQIMNHVHFSWLYSKPYPLIKYAKALVHTSVAEGFPNVIAEALALNFPHCGNSFRGRHRVAFRKWTMET